MEPSYQRSYLGIISGVLAVEEVGERVGYALDLVPTAKPHGGAKKVGIRRARRGAADDPVETIASVRCHTPRSSA